MKKQYSVDGRLTILVLILVLLGPRAYAGSANDAVQFNNLIQTTHEHRAQMEARLGIDPNADPYPKASSYYDDLVDHYEQDQLMRDVIDEGLTSTPR